MPDRVIPRGVRFAQIPHDLILDTRVSHTAKCVYMYLMHRASNEGQSFPSMRTIGTELGMSTSTVNAGVNLLAELGWLEIERGERQPGDRKKPVNTYYIHGTLVASTEQDSSDNRTSTVAIDATELHPDITTPTELQEEAAAPQLALVECDHIWEHVTVSRIRCGNCPKVRDMLWEVFVEIHGNPADDNERGKFNRYVSKLRKAGVSAKEYPLLVQAFTSKNNGLQPAVATVANRIGEMRNYVEKGPISAPSPDELEENRLWQEAQAEYDRIVGTKGALP